MRYGGEAVEGRRSKGAINEERIVVTDKCCGSRRKSVERQGAVDNWILGSGGRKAYQTR